MEDWLAALTTIANPGQIIVIHHKGKSAPAKTPSVDELEID
jgi:hypothetical protein